MIRKKLCQHLVQIRLSVTFDREALHPCPAPILLTSSYFCIAMEGDNRRTSVYDLTGLRVHPNGYRVHQTQNNLSLGKYGRNVQGSRGWIADDAGGSIAIPKYRSGRPTPSSEAGEAEYIQMEETGTSREDGEAESEAEESGSAKGKRRKKQNNMAPIKRRKFFQDDSYISGLSQVAGSSGAGLEIPSQVSFNCHMCLVCC